VIDDWLSIIDNKQTRKIIKKYAYRARVLTLMLLYSVYGSTLSLYFVLLWCASNTTNWILLLSCSPLRISITGSFFFNITMHLAGQLEPNTEANYRKKFIRLINRHSKLMEFYKNLEDFFNLFILIKLVTVTIVLAFIGLRINLCLMENNHIEVAKNALVVNFCLMESMVLTYGGDFLQRESEGIFYAL
ncbi:Odorant receptor 385, partial [Nylanderia fulva]